MSGLHENKSRVPRLRWRLLMRCQAQHKVYGYGTDNISYKLCGVRLKQKSIRSRICPECGSITARGPAWPGPEALLWNNRSSEKRTADRKKIRRARARRHLGYVPLHIFAVDLTELRSQNPGVI